MIATRKLAGGVLVGIAACFSQVGVSAAPTPPPVVRPPVARPATGPATAPAAPAPAANPWQPLTEGGSLSQAQVDRLWKLADLAEAEANQLAGEFRKPNQETVAEYRQLIAALAAASGGDLAPAAKLLSGEGAAYYGKMFEFACRLAVASGHVQALGKLPADLSADVRLAAARMQLRSGDLAGAAANARAVIDAAGKAPAPEPGFPPQPPLEVLSAAQLLAEAGKGDEALRALTTFAAKLQPAGQRVDQVRMVALAAAGKPADAAAAFRTVVPTLAMAYRPQSLELFDALRSAARYGAGPALMAEMKAVPAGRDMPVAVVLAIAEGEAAAGRKPAAAAAIADAERRAGTDFGCLLLVERAMRATGDVAGAARIRKAVFDRLNSNPQTAFVGATFLVEVDIDAGDLAGARRTVALIPTTDQAASYRVQALTKIVEGCIRKGDVAGAKAALVDATKAVRSIPCKVPPTQSYEYTALRYRATETYRVAALQRRVGDAAGAGQTIAEAAKDVAASRGTEPPHRNSDLAYDLLAAQSAAGDAAGAAETARRIRVVVDEARPEEQAMLAQGAISARAATGDVNGALAAAAALKAPMTRCHVYTTLIDGLLGPAAKESPSGF